MEQARCKSKPQEWFFPTRGKNTRSAAKVCAACPVFDECEEYALTTGSYGFWAGEMRYGPPIEEEPNEPAVALVIVATESDSWAPVTDEDRLFDQLAEYSEAV
jgi:hypothetical protein